MNPKLAFFFQAEDGIRDQPRSRGLGDVYKRQVLNTTANIINTKKDRLITIREASKPNEPFEMIFRLRHRT